MELHILGIGGTFMASLAILADAMGHRVTGQDRDIYPPMSDQLAEHQIPVFEGYRSDVIPPESLVIVGNALSRGNPAVECVLNRGQVYTSGPRWLQEHVLGQREIIAVAGTHGKTTTASLIAWLLEQAGFQPGFLIGGIPENFGISARLGTGPYFVIEADEYDTAFFAKHPKFLYYRPRVLVTTNLEYDHGDIYPDLEHIKQVFHQLIRIVPGNGRILVNQGDSALEDVLKMGCWTPVESFGLQSRARWSATLGGNNGQSFSVFHCDQCLGSVNWSLRGTHNIENALAAVGAVSAVTGSDPMLEAVSSFAGVRRRMTAMPLARNSDVTLYDDFAHHPTAIRRTLEGLVGVGRIIVALEPRSNSMRRGMHSEHLKDALAFADMTYVYRRPDLSWEPSDVLCGLGPRLRVHDDVDSLVKAIVAEVRSGDRIVVMSNGSFEGCVVRLAEALSRRSTFL